MVCTGNIILLNCLEDYVKGIVADDKVLSINSDALISATVSLDYDSENKAIKLYGKDNVELGSVDATPFIKDGMLDGVDYNADNNTLTFTWNTVAGKTEDTVVLSDIIEPYTAGEGLELSGNEFKGKLKDNKPFYREQLKHLIYLMGARNAFRVIRFHSNRQRRRVYQEVFGKYKNKERLNE